VQRVIHARGAEQGERRGCAGRQFERVVGDRVVHGGEVGHVENVAQRPVGHSVAGARCRDVDVAAIGEVNRDRLIRLADLDRHVVVLDQQADLLGEIATEQVGPRHAGLVHARPRNETVGEPRVDARVRRGRDAHERIGGAHPRRERRATGKDLEMIAQEAGVALIDFLEARDGAGGVGEGLGRDRRRGEEACGLHHGYPRFTPSISSTTAPASAHMSTYPGPTGTLPWPPGMSST
jgi:hypothetical protein